MIHKKESYTYSILLLFLLLPSVVYLKELPLHGDIALYPGVREGQRVFDIFAYYKSLLIPTLTLCSLGLFLWGNRFSIKRGWTIPALLMIAATVISSLFSQYKPLPFTGSMELFETAFVWLSYVGLFFLGYELVRHQASMRKLILTLFIGLIPFMTIGLFQFFGDDPFQWLWVKKLILPESYHKYTESFSFHNDAHEVYSTIGNPNYMGSLVPLLLPLSIYLLFTNEKLWIRILGAVSAVALVLILIGSRSRAGLVGSIGVGISFWFFYWRALPRWANVIIPLCTAGSVLVGVLFFANKERNQSHCDISQLEVTETGFTVYTKDVELSFSVEEGQLMFRGDEGASLNAVVDPTNPERYTLKEEGYEDFSFHFGIKPKDHLKVFYRGFSYVFYIIKGKFWIRYYDGEFQEISEPRRVQLLDPYEHLASDRVYIWSRSIPLLFSDGLLGSGADTYPLVFPQNDFYGKRRSYGHDSVIVTKPHNLYLQIGISLGIVALIGFLWLCGRYYIKVNTLLKGNNVTFPQKQYLAVITAGVTGYLFAGLFNDSSVSVGIYFWILLGVGSGLVHMQLEEQK